MRNVLAQGPDFWRWFDTTQVSYHCVHLIHAKVFAIQMLLYFRQISPRFCILELFIIHVDKTGSIIPSWLSISDILATWLCNSCHEQTKMAVQVPQQHEEKKLHVSACTTALLTTASAVWCTQCSVMALYLTSSICSSLYMHASMP